MDQPKLETKPFDFWLFWMVQLHIWQHIRVRVPLHHNSFLNFSREWTRFRWIRSRFVQGCPIVCTMWRDFRQDRTLLGHIELRWCTTVQEVSFGTSGHSIQNFGQDYSVTNHTCSVDAQGSDDEKHTGNSECQNACGVSPGKKTKRFHRPSFHESRTADIHNNQTGLSQWGDSKI